MYVDKYIIKGTESFTFDGEPSVRKASYMMESDSTFTVLVLLDVLNIPEI